MKPAACNQCGAAIQFDDSDRPQKCEYCGGSFRRVHDIDVTKPQDDAPPVSITKHRQRPASPKTSDEVKSNDMPFGWMVATLIMVFGGGMAFLYIMLKLGQD